MRKCFFPTALYQSSDNSGTVGAIKNDDSGIGHIFVPLLAVAWRGHSGYGHAP